MSVVQLSEVRLMAVDLDSGQITFSPHEGGVRLMDVKDDVVLVTIPQKRGFSHGGRPTLAIGRLHDEYW